jgi:hypothetical protein
MKIKCLLVKLEDGRKFFTLKSNQKKLMEFALLFKAKLEIVEAYDPHLISLSELAIAICDQNNKGNDCVNKLFYNEPEVVNYIINQFKSGKNVKIKKIAKKFSKDNVSPSTIYRHVKRIKNMLESENKSVIKISPGIYKIDQS